MQLPGLTAIALLFALTTPWTLASAQTATDGSDVDVAAIGHKLYIANCSSCHQATGQGMTNMSPALKDNPIVSGESAQLIQILLKGPAAVLPANRPRYGTSTMDSFYYKLTDDQVAAILTYIRQEFGKDDKAPPVDVKDVAAARAKIDPQTLNN